VSAIAKVSINKLTEFSTDKFTTDDSSGAAFPSPLCCPMSPRWHCWDGANKSAWNQRLRREWSERHIDNETDSTCMQQRQQRHTVLL